MKKILLFAFAAMVVAMSAMATPAKRGVWKTLKLADGTEVRAQLVGDEFGHYWLGVDGNRYTSEGNTLDLSTVAEKRAEKLRAKAQSRRVNRLRKMKEVGGSTYTGQKKGLIILAQFSDKKFMDGNDNELYNKIANQAGFTDEDMGFEGSVADYFKDQSRGKFELTFDVVGPVTVSKTYSYYGGNDSRGDDKYPGAFIAEVINLAKNSVSNWSQYDWDNDGEVDQVMIIYAGEGEASSYDENTLWPHEWQLEASDYGRTISVGTNLKVNTYAIANECEPVDYDDYNNPVLAIGGIGTVCHEFSHCLGLPDMYDTSYSGWFGMNAWSLMDQGSYNNYGFTPAGYTSLERWLIGWEEPIELSADREVTDLKPLINSGESYVVYNQKDRNEFYLLENRQKVSWDAAVPASGLLVLHVDYDQDIWDYNLPNTKNTSTAYGPLNDHQRCTIFHADGVDKYNEISEKIDQTQDWMEYYDLLDELDADLAGDVYPQENNNELTNTSTPRAFTYNKNTDNRKLMNISITSIGQLQNGNIAFNFAFDNSGSGEEGDNTGTGGGTTKPDIEGALFYESFDLCAGTGGNDGSWSGNIATSKFNPDNSGWVAESVNGADQCAKFGSSKKTGVATSPSFAINGKATLTFRAAPFGTDGTSLTVSVASGNATVSPSAFTMKANQFTEFTATLQGSGNISLKFTPSKRFFLDEVLVMDEETGINGTLINANGANNGVYSIDGRQMHGDFNKLGRGIYIINGQKVIK